MPIPIGPATAGAMVPYNPKVPENAVAVGGFLSFIDDMKQKVAADSLKEKKNTAKNTQTGSRSFSRFVKRIGMGDNKKLYDFPLSSREPDAPTAPDMLMAWLLDDLTITHQNKPAEKLKACTLYNYFCAISREWNKYQEEHFRNEVRPFLRSSRFPSHAAFPIYNISTYLVSRLLQPDYRGPVCFLTHHEWSYARDALNCRLPDLPGSVDHYAIPTRKEAEQIFNSAFFKRQDLYSFLLKLAFSLMCEIWPRGGEELRSISVDHFELLDAGIPFNGEREPGERIVFDPNLLKQKTRAGDLSDFKKVFKLITIFPNQVNPQFCFVRQFKDLIDIRTRLNFQTTAFFPFIKQDKSTGVWSFSDKPIQLDIAATFFQRVCYHAGLQNYTAFANHGVRAWMITEALAAGTEEHAVKDRSRHTSNTAVQAYKNATNLEQASLGFAMHKRAAGISTTINQTRQQLCDTFENVPPQNHILIPPDRDIPEHFPDSRERRHFRQNVPPLRSTESADFAQSNPRQHAPDQLPSEPQANHPPPNMLPPPPHHFPPPHPPPPPHFPMPFPADHFLAPAPLPPPPGGHFDPGNMMVPNPPQMQSWNVGNNAVINVHYHHGPTISHVSSQDRHVYNYANANEAMQETGWADLSPTEWDDFCE